MFERIQIMKKAACALFRTYTVGWSDLALFAIFEKLHVSADQVYF